jgi:hypothetical protein
MTCTNVTDKCLAWCRHKNEHDPIKIGKRDTDIDDTPKCDEVESYCAYGGGKKICK